MTKEELLKKLMDVKDDILKKWESSVHKMCRCKIDNKEFQYLIDDCNKFKYQHTTLNYVIELVKELK